MFTSSKDLTTSMEVPISNEGNWGGGTSSIAFLV